jgi:hypothetical protein
LLKPNSEDAAAGSRLKPPATRDDELAQLGTSETEPADHESYAALLTLSPPRRTHRLARLLHWDRAASDVSSPSLTLDQCLARVPAAGRRRAIEAYWNTREQAARCQVVSDQNDQLAALYPAVLRGASEPGGAEAMLDLRAHQQAAEADLLDAQARLLERRLELAAAAGRDANSKDWPLPVTPPHGGRYEMKLESQPQQLVQSPAMRGLSTALPGLYAALEDRAEAIVRLDGQRAAAAEALPVAGTRLDLTGTLELIDRQAIESLAFLSTLTRYNLVIAEYALTVLPSVNAVDLTAAMVVQ